MYEVQRNGRAFTLYATHYTAEKAKYDEILSAIGEYFELFKTHTDLLEDLWLQLLKFLELPNPQTKTVFKKIHYQCYNKLVINNPHIRLMIDFAEQSFDQKDGSDLLGSYLEKIREIKDGGHSPDETYQEFNAGY